MPLNPVLRPRSWTEDVCGVVADLQELNHTTETDFLAVGGNLMAFLSASRRLHGDIAGLTALVSGEQAQHACDALVSVRHYVQEMRRRSKEGGHALLMLRADAERIRRGFSSFGEIASSFRIIAVQARIEAAHLATSQKNLKNLADDVHSCSDCIRASVGQVLQVATEFDSRIASTLLEVSHLEAVRLQELPSLLAEVDADVEVFRVRQRESVEVSSKLAAQLDSVAQQLGAVAISIQFHDITRQQVEHVIEALEGLSRDAPDADLVRLQKAQLQSAAAAFDKSTRKIDRDLSGIAACVGQMVDASNCIHGLDPLERDSFLGGMQRRLAVVAQAVSELHSLELGARTIVADLQGSHQGLGTAVNEIQSMELELKLISLNAIISASQIGARGETLKAIAGDIRELRVESESRSGDARKALDSIGNAIRSLAGSDAPAASDIPFGGLLEDLNTRMADLQSASASGAAAAAGVAALSHRLRADLQNARDHFGIGQVFADAVARCCDSLDGVASQAQQCDSSSTVFAGKTSEARYTMETERNVHRAITSSVTADLSSEECGEEVEFF